MPLQSLHNAEMWYLMLVLYVIHDVIHLAAEDDGRTPLRIKKTSISRVQQLTVTPTFQLRNLAAARDSFLF